MVFFFLNFEFWITSLLKGHNFLNSIPFLMIFNVPDPWIRKVQVLLDTRNTWALPLDRVCPECLSVRSPAGLLVLRSSFPKCSHPKPTTALVYTWISHHPMQEDRDLRAYSSRVGGKGKIMLTFQVSNLSHSLGVGVRILPFLWPCDPHRL
jgi:hypothetical protein